MRTTPSNTQRMESLALVFISAPDCPPRLPYAEMTFPPGSGKQNCESARHSRCISTLFPFENSPGVCTLTWLRSMCVNPVFTGSSACIFTIQRNNSPNITIKRFISLKIKKFYILGIRKFLQQVHHIVYILLQTFTTTICIHNSQQMSGFR